MSYKNDEELKAGIEKWRSGRLRDRNPSGYQQHLSDVSAYNAAKNSNSGTTSGTTTTTQSEDKKDNDKGKKWSPTKKEEKLHNKNIKDTKAAAKAAKNFKPKRLPGVQQKKYEVTLPKRPSVPKLPKLNIPGGGLTISKAKKPSGLPGTINKYSPKSDYSKSYPNALPKKKGKKK